MEEPLAAAASIDKSENKKTLERKKIFGETNAECTVVTPSSLYLYFF